MTEDEQLRELMALCRDMSPEALEDLMRFARLWAEQCPREREEVGQPARLRLRLVR